MGDHEKIAELRDKIYQAIETLEDMGKFGALVDIANFTTQALSGMLRKGETNNG